MSVIYVISATAELTQDPCFACNVSNDHANQELPKAFSTSPTLPTHSCTEQNKNYMLVSLRAKVEMKIELDSRVLVRLLHLKRVIMYVDIAKLL